MEQKITRMIDSYDKHPAITSVLSFDCSRHIQSIEGFDLLILIVTNDDLETDHISHYIKDNVRIQELLIYTKDLERRIFSGQNGNIVQWILQGEIVLDKGSYLQHLKSQLIHISNPMMEQRLLNEFSCFLRKSLLCKQYLQEGHVLDAFSEILEALRHWARIAIIEEGHDPELTVWNQLRKINPGVYKLYEELTSSSETLEQRVQLVLLGCEFTMLSKMENCCSLLIRILSSRRNPWSLKELMEHPDLQAVSYDYAVVLHHLVKRKLIKEVAVVDSLDLDRLYLKYTV